eukprot:CAMPEP_0201124064 /NCGR_PEP_ID=MMETSP0850-20130426/10360_1 /ASSEMBLY_ACC=CAM_ASM_000622 /TAXON_ID=183588 /ORGANISM="Pseudo-nitzschia fraudulenta, Strain WWA7" /LENGTH=54 /DNA_ID=CAMNT_0047391251 /DNA_START=111 /DNA_END=275 /DNA_ORIENTATION=-
MSETAPLPVPNQLKAQLKKCKTVRNADTYCQSREKSAKEMKESKSKLPPLEAKN